MLDIVAALVLCTVCSLFMMIMLVVPLLSVLFVRSDRFTASTVGANCLCRALLVRSRVRQIILPGHEYRSTLHVVQLAHMYDTGTRNCKLKRHAASGTQNTTLLSVQ